MENVLSKVKMIIVLGAIFALSFGCTTNGSHQSNGSLESRTAANIDQKINPREETDLRANQPMFIDPVADLIPYSGEDGTGSWFIVANLKDGDHEFGLLFHFRQFLTEEGIGKTIQFAITDVETGDYIVHEEADGVLSAIDNGFSIKSESSFWMGTAQEMTFKGSNEDISFDLAASVNGPVLAYNGTGAFPLFDDNYPNGEYAFPVMDTTGTITINGTKYNVEGNSWFDRQWGVLPGKDLVGGTGHWLWMAIKLSNGDIVAVWDTVLTRTHSWVNILHPDGTLTIADISPTDDNRSGFWTSKNSGWVWPSEWEISAPGADLNLKVWTTSEGQETLMTLPRIEGVIHVDGTYEGESITGSGYVELVGMQDGRRDSSSN